MRKSLAVIAAGAAVITGGTLAGVVYGGRPTSHSISNHLLSSGAGPAGPSGRTTNTTIPPATNTPGAAATTTPTTTATTASGTGPSTQALSAGHPWPRRTVGDVPFFAVPAFVPGPSLMIGLVNKGMTQSTPEQIESVSVVTGKVTLGPVINGDSEVLAYGDSAWAVIKGMSGLWTLNRINTSTLALGEGAPLGELCTSANQPVGLVTFQPSGPSAGDAWVCSGGALELVEPSSGKVVHRIALPAGVVGSVAVEPDGEYVDVSVMTRQGPIDVLEFATSTYQLAARSDGWPSPGAPALTPVDGGVWMSIRSGMDGMAIRLDEGTLATSPAGSGDLPPSDPEGNLPLPQRSESMGVQVFAGPGLVVLTDGAGSSCVVPDGTRVLAAAFFAPTLNASFGHGWLPVGSVGHTLYVVTFGVETEAAVSVPAVC